MGDIVITFFSFTTLLYLVAGRLEAVYHELHSFYHQLSCMFLYYQRQPLWPIAEYAFSEFVFVFVLLSIPIADIRLTSRSS